jgi:hypothetical protein
MGSRRLSGQALAAALLAFIAGVTVASVAGWALRDRIRDRMIRRRVKSQ